tara:strand:+ start:184 stop:414 length:231 start_codon:yes stop_codon:yes gene_type:complete
MEELLDMIVTDESPSQISDAIKNMLYTKTAERVDTFRPSVSDTVFDHGETSEIDAEMETDDDETVDTDDEIEQEED